MRLSICCLANAPGPRVTNSLGRLRDVADEIVIGADSRTSNETRREYATVADCVSPLQFEFAERHLSWLYAQCSGDWILRLDDDEVVGSALIERLPWLMAQDVQQYWVPRRWLYPSPAQWLDEPPWWPDYHNRLVRNNAQLRFSGELHTGAEPVLPCRFLEWPIYHLECILKDRTAREQKVERQRRQRPGLIAPGGGEINAAYYVPELTARLDPAAVPGEDLAAIAQVFDPPAHAGIITPLERAFRFSRGEQRAVHFRVHNSSSMRWDAGADVRLSYRWKGCAAEGARTAFCAAVDPGTSSVIPLVVTAPSQPGTHEMEVDLVHEHVRWFEQPIRIQIQVE